MFMWNIEIIFLDCFEKFWWKKFFVENDVEYLRYFKIYLYYKLCYFLVFRKGLFD